MKSILALIFTFVIGALPLQASDSIELLVIRSEHKLIIKRDGQPLKSFRVAFGSGGKKAKLREGDRTTPKGSYRISEVRDSQRFHLFMQLNYPNIDDAKRALRNFTISREQYQAILDAHIYGHLPPQNTPLGGIIGIHGIGHETKDKLAIHKISDWTQGCIAMRNNEIDELKRYVDVGTRITIIE